MFSINQMWYSPRWYHVVFMVFLLPLSLLFWLISTTRRIAFKLKIKSSDNVDATVIVVGNISVGGTGKTPLVVYLTHLLQKQGFKVGVLTRGYGGKSDVYPLAVEHNSLAMIVGDEPMLMRQNVDCPVVVDPIRVRGAHYLVEHFHCDVILCDDGLQHYALQRDIEIAVIDGKRRLGNQLLLPAGPLREGAWRLQQVDFTIVNGAECHSNEFPMVLSPSVLHNVKNPHLHCDFKDFKQPFTAVAGIGNPQRFFSLLAQLPLTIYDTLSFIDHHAFKASDFPAGAIVMTEKDAVKCRTFAQDNWWYVPVTSTLPETFEIKFLSKVKSIHFS